MKKQLTILMVCIFLYPLRIPAQDSVLFGGFTRTQLMEEYDTLIGIIETANPHLPLYKKMMGLDVVQQLKDRRETINGIKSLSDYWYILNTSLEYIPEQHCRWLSFDDYQEENRGYWKNRYPAYFEPAQFEKTRHFLNTVIDDQQKSGEKEDFIFQFLLYTIQHFYLDGVYRSVYEQNYFLSNGDSLVLPQGAILQSINKEPPAAFVHRHMLQGDYKNSRYMYWDVQKKDFYTSSPTALFSLIKNKPDIVMEYRVPQRPETLRVKLAEIVRGRYGNPFYDSTLYCKDTREFQEEEPPQLAVWDSVLYIRIPKMDRNNLPFYREELLKQKEDIQRKVKRLIIDIRQNLGGDDGVWMELLSLLTDRDICSNKQLAIRDTPLFPDLPALFGKEYSKDSLPLVFDSVLETPYRLLGQQEPNLCTYKISPSDNSIRYKGKIYLLHNRKSYSSANSLVMQALESDKLVAVGEPTGILGGYGIAPSAYRLPLTGMIFLMHSTLHIPQNPTDISDYFWNKTEVPVQSNLEHELIQYFHCNDYSHEYLFKQDPFFRKVLEIQEE